MPPKKAKIAIPSARKPKKSRKKPKIAPKIFQYSEQQMMLALAEVKNNDISVRDAARVPKQRWTTKPEVSIQLKENGSENLFGAGDREQDCEMFVYIDRGRIPSDKDTAPG